MASLDKMLADAKKEIKKEVIKQLKEKAKEDIPAAMEYTVDELQREATNMYNTLITQFYLYRTTSYVRHWEGRPGTMKGSNLYYAFHARKLHKNGLPLLSIRIDAEDMADGYKLDSKEGVLDAVLMGIRWPYDFSKKDSEGKTVKDSNGSPVPAMNKADMTWSGSYQGKYFAYRGVPEEIFDSFFENFENIATPIFFRKFHELGW